MPEAAGRFLSYYPKTTRFALDGAGSRSVLAECGQRKTFPRLAKGRGGTPQPILPLDIVLKVGRKARTSAPGRIQVGCRRTVSYHVG